MFTCKRDSPKGREDVRNDMRDWKGDNAVECVTPLATLRQARRQEGKIRR
jgi:hypothetical protein